MYIDSNLSASLDDNTTETTVSATGFHNILEESKTVESESSHDKLRDWLLSLQKNAP